MKLTIRAFVLLDVLSLVFLGMQLWQISNHYNELQDQVSVKLQAILLFPLFVLIVISAIGLLKFRKFGFILYYIQFPFRLYLWVFSIGFITLLPEALGYYDDKYFDTLLKVCFMAEFIRLYLTIKVQFNLRERSH